MERRKFVSAFTTITAFTASLLGYKVLARQEQTYKRIKDTLYDVFDTNTGEVFTYTKVTKYLDGSLLTDNKIDGIIYRKINREYFKRNFAGPVNVKWFGSRGDNTADDTLSIQKALDFCANQHHILFFPTGTYLVTNTLNIFNGSQLKGETNFQYAAGFGREPKGTTIRFNPTNEKDLFNYIFNPGSEHPPVGFLFHTSISSFYLKGNSTRENRMLSRHALNLSRVIYGLFENIGIEGFRTPINCQGTINNRFENIYTSGTANSISIGGTATTDVWNQCSFWGSPIGILTNGSSIGIRFTSCLFEQIGLYGADISKETETMTFANCYSEDTPYTNNANAAMFRVGYSGSKLVVENSLTVIGGKYSGKNVGPIGSFLSSDETYGIMLLGVTVSRFTTIIKASENTKANSIIVLGMGGISWGTFCNNMAKISGVYPHGVLNNSPNGQNGSLLNLTVKHNATITTLVSNYVAPPSSFFAPANDNKISLGVSNLRYSTIFAGSGTINTSDQNEKQQIEQVSEAERRVAKAIKNGIKKFKFNEAVNFKGMNARIHFGVLAQEVSDAFHAEGLDAHKYALFCEDTWIEKDGEKVLEPKGEEGEFQKTRLGIRYDELLAFMISAL